MIPKNLTQGVDWTMKKLSLTMFALILFACPAILSAASRTVTLTWTMSDTTNVSGYRVYYADNSAMNNKLLHSDCSSITENPSNTFTITCNNVNLTDNQAYYFAIAAIITNASESNSEPEQITYVTTVKNLRVISSEAKRIPKKQNYANTDFESLLIYRTITMRNIS